MPPSPPNVYPIPMVDGLCIKNNNPCLEKGNFLKNDGSEN